MYRDKISFKFRCEKHKKYNPDISGENGIVGGCVSCHKLFNIYSKLCIVKKEIRQYEEFTNERTKSDVKSDV